MTADKARETPRVDELLLEINEGRVYADYGPTVNLARQLERELWAAREDARIRGSERAELKRRVVEAKERIADLEEEAKHSTEGACRLQAELSALRSRPPAMPSEPEILYRITGSFGGGAMLDHDQRTQIARYIDALARYAEGMAKENERLRNEKDGAYLERNKLVSALSKLFPAGKARTAIEGWSDDWHGCVFIDLPTGQASWHYHDSQESLFEHLPPYQGKWDGHSTEEKYQRIAAIAQKEQP